MLDSSQPRRIAQKDLQSISREAHGLSKLPRSQLLRIVRAGTAKQFPGKTVLLREGAQVEEVYFILRGMVAVGLYQDSNPALWLYVSGPGSMVDTCALLDPPVSPVSINALSDVDVLAVPRSVLVEVIEEEPTVGYQMLRTLCTKMAIINQVTMKELTEEYPGPSIN